MNRQGLVSFVPGHDCVELYDGRSRAMVGKIEAEFADSLAFRTPGLLCLRTLFNPELWDVTDPGKAVSVPWPDWLPEKKIQRVLPLGESGRAWLLGNETLVLADWNRGKVETTHEIGEDRGSVMAGTPDGLHVALGGKILERWSGTDGFYYDKNQKPISLLAYSPSGLHLAAVTKTDYSESDNRVDALILNTSTRIIVQWNFVRDTQLIFFWSDAFLLGFTSGDLRIMDLAAGKEAVRVKHDYIYLSDSTLNSTATALIYADGAMTVHVMDVRPFVSGESAREALYPGDTGVDSRLMAPEQWPEWWRKADPPLTLPDDHVPNPRFGQTVFSLLADHRCEKMDLTGVSGLDPAVRDKFIERGAIYKAGVIERLRKLVL
jgi:hypothetical protein